MNLLMTSSSVAAGVLMAWDIMITLDDEIDLIWLARPNLISVVYLFIRYLALAPQIVNLLFYANVSGIIAPTLTNCKFWQWFYGSVGFVLVVTINIVFLLRIFAFYGRSVKVLCLLILLFLGTLAGIILLSLRVEHADRRFPSPLPPRLHISVCFSLIVPHDLPRLWVPELVYQTVLFLLLVGKFAYTYQHNPFSLSKLILVFIRDGTWAFFVISATLVYSTIAYNIDINAGANASAWYYTVIGICGSRVVLNLRKEATRDGDGDRSYRSAMPFSEILFGKGRSRSETINTYCPSSPNMGVSGYTRNTVTTTNIEWMQMSPTSTALGGNLSGSGRSDF